MDGAGGVRVGGKVREVKGKPVKDCRVGRSFLRMV
jgi:hypothetical protein